MPSGLHSVQREPIPVVNSGNFEVAIFSIEVPERERERELSKEQYAIEAAAEVAYCFELNSLSLSGTQN